MKVALRSLLFASSFLILGVHCQAADTTTGPGGMYCYSDCSACWKIGSPGVDIKIGCNSSSAHCPSTCPPGYENRHCAKWERCLCYPPYGCDIFGPCLCGYYTDSLGWKRCKVPDDSLNCP